MIERLAQYHPLLPDLAVILILLFGAWAAYIFTSRILLVALRTVAKRTSQTWDDALIENRVGAKLAQLVPVFIIYVGVDLLPSINKTAETLVMNVKCLYDRGGNDHYYCRPQHGK